MEPKEKAKAKAKAFLQSKAENLRSNEVGATGYKQKRAAMEERMKARKAKNEEDVKQKIIERRNETPEQAEERRNRFREKIKEMKAKRAARKQKEAGEIPSA